MNNVLTIAVTIMLCMGNALAQRLPKDVPMPPINAGPGRSVEVKSVVKHYNFWGLKREVALPWERILLKKSAIPTGVKLSSTSMSPSPSLTKLIASPSIMLGGIEAPAKKEVQHFKGTNAADNGTIVYLHWSKKLPADMRERLAKIFYSKNVRPDGPQLVEFIVNDNTVIIWAFTKHESAVKQAHQEEIFNLVSEIANKMFPPTDAKSPSGR